MPKIKYIKQNVFLILAILTIGFPFVGYKILTAVLIQNIYGVSRLTVAFSVFFAVWGVIDLYLNAVSLYLIVCHGNKERSVCLLSAIARRISFLSRWEDCGEALDVMLSFVIVAIAVGRNLFVFMSPLQVKIWNSCTVVNVLGAGIARLGSSLCIIG